VISQNLFPNRSSHDLRRQRPPSVAPVAPVHRTTLLGCLPSSHYLAFTEQLGCVSPAKRNGRRFFISHAWFRKRKKKKIKQNQRLLGFDKMSFEGKSQTRVVGVLGSCIFVVACFNWSKRQVVGQPKKKKRSGGMFLCFKVSSEASNSFQDFSSCRFHKSKSKQKTKFLLGFLQQWSLFFGPYSTESSRIKGKVRIRVNKLDLV
jgi:hypothetical protein